MDTAKAREMSPEEAAKVEARWLNSKECADLQARQRKLAKRIEVLNVGSYAPMDRVRVVE